MLEDRRDGGKRLAELLGEYEGQRDVIVLALPRGGVPVAYEIASALRVPLDVFIVRKIGMPGREELALGAIASGGYSWINQPLLGRLQISEDSLRAVIQKEREELRRREQCFRPDQPPLNLRGRIVILVDDGLATGASMRAAIQAVRAADPKKLIVAVPVIAGTSYTAIRSDVDDLVCILAPYEFNAVGEWYENFDQVSDEEVKFLLSQAGHHDFWSEDEKTSEVALNRI